MGQTLNKLASDIQCLGVYIDNDAIGCLSRDEKRRYCLNVKSEEFQSCASEPVRTVGSRLAKHLSAMLNNKDGTPNEGARNFIKNQKIVIEHDRIMIKGAVSFYVPISSPG